MHPPRHRAGRPRPPPEVGARELLEAHLARIDRFDGQVNAIVTRDDDAARAAADEADARLARGEAVGPLHGVPVAHKDTHQTGGMRTTWGSPLHRDTVPARDELVVARLREAGAIRVGKTNVPEFAPPARTPSTPSSAPPTTPTGTACPRAGPPAAAAALAAGFVPLAEGSDMGGSLRNPAAFCNVVGLRPTPGRVPSHPTAIGWSQLSVQGPMARTVSDVALGLSVLAGPDPRVPISLSDPGAGFAAPLPTELTGLRIAWTPGPRRAGAGRPGDHRGAHGAAAGVPRPRRRGRGGLPRPDRRRRGVRHAARVAVRGLLRRRRPPVA